MVFLLVGAWLLLGTPVLAQAACEGAYLVCMHSCASGKNAERCMQVCATEQTRCGVTGRFRPEPPKAMLRSGTDDFGAVKWRSEGTAPPGIPKSRQPSN
jgi:hypothetical protein